MIWGGTYFLLGIILQGAIGGGDIKLALITGTSAAMHSPLAVVYAMIAAQLVTLCAGTMMYFYEKLRVSWRDARKRRIMLMASMLSGT
ncbi:hypothetical protein LJU02_05855 [Corynebacterium pseudotuberculosis]|nr:hypothetical protein [Corynebacterium pseudotuberculosis]ATV80584.1 Hypothetical protein BFF97_01855 [Corynebacterium pseudotuberculosis]WAE78021.1 hypothetical protein LJU20_05860 [Corynebacterium pseudotuberculosis]WAE80071.1 hypothetical protein LJU19_05855 [Corynebacterium pseudotuberculosis]WAE82119.1 hypothetical protein LJU18_05855 [Corynebacterium pseudotuberculosis]WAE84167.1 hypothetical protein LJU17_05850 [Corynebacterium pseudotuberculosis]